MIKYLQPPLNNPGIPPPPPIQLPQVPLWPWVRFLASLDRRSTKPPLPQLCILPVQLSLQHIHNILSDNRHELEAVPGAPRANKEVLGARVGADAEVNIFGVAVPIKSN